MRVVLVNSPCVRRGHLDVGADLVEERHVGAGKNAALMVVGAAGIITGAIVGGGTGAAIAVGGAALGLYGLYNFVK